MTRQEALGIETNYRLETTVQDVHAHLLAGFVLCAILFKEKRKCYRVVLGIPGWMSCSMLQDAYSGVGKQVIY